MYTRSLTMPGMSLRYRVTLHNWHDEPQTKDFKILKSACGWMQYQAIRCHTRNIPCDPKLESVYVHTIIR